MSRALDVQSRGGFFDDPFFRDSWTNFDTKMQRAMGHFDGMESLQSPRVVQAAGGRNMRSPPPTDGRLDPQQSDQAIQVVEKDGRFQVVMDVKDFDPRNLQVRAVEDNRIVVEGKYQQASEDSGSNSWKTFSKEFTLPEEADIDLVSTALSKDGVLTIKAPRKTEYNIQGTPKPKSNTVQSINESYNEQRSPNGVATKSYKSTSSATSSSFKTGGGKGLQSSSSFESCDSGLDSLPRDIRDRLMVNEHGMSSVSSSNSSCSSPAPSEAASDVSRVSTTMEFDIGNNARSASRQRSEVTFNVEAPGNESLSRSQSNSQTDSERVQSPDAQSTVSSSRYSTGSKKSDRYAPPNITPIFMPTVARVPTFTAGCGSSGDTNVTIEEKDGKRTVTSERANVIHEKDGVLESREISAEIDEKDGQSARREALTRISRKHDDPEGRYIGAEKAEASDVSESCIKKLPDGSTMSVKKSSTSSSSHKSFSTSGGSMGAFDDPFFSGAITSDFGDLRSLMGRGHSLMSQMSTDSMGSTMSGRSANSDRSRFSEKSNRSETSERSNSRLSDTSNASDRSHTSNRSFSDRSQQGEPSRHSGSPDGSMRSRLGMSDRVSLFPERSMFADRPSLSDRFPSFANSMAEFDDFADTHFSDFPSFGSGSSLSRTSRQSQNSFSKSAFDSAFDRF